MVRMVPSKKHMPKANIKVSIIIPTYNRKDYLAKAIESSLSQDYPFIEVIVSDNASSDGTDKACRKYNKNKRFKYFRNKKNLGMSANWEKALYKHAKGDYVLLLSDDDYLINKSYVSLCIKKIMKYNNKNENKNIVLVHSNYKILNEYTGRITNMTRNLPEFNNGKEYFLNYPYEFKRHFILCSTMFKRDLALKLNAFKNDYMASDLELFLKMCLKGDVVFIRRHSVVYRIHSKSESSLLDIKKRMNTFDAIDNIYKAGIKVFRDKNKLKKWRVKLINKYLLDDTLAQIILLKKRKQIIKFFKYIYSNKKLPNTYFLYWRTWLRMTSLISFKFYFFLLDIYTKMNY